MLSALASPFTLQELNKKNVINAQFISIFPLNSFKLEKASNVNVM